MGCMKKVTQQPAHRHGSMNERTNMTNELLCCTTKFVVLLFIYSIDTTGTLLSAVGVYCQRRCNGRAGREDIVSESIDYHHDYIPPLNPVILPEKI